MDTDTIKTALRAAGVENVSVIDGSGSPLTVEDLAALKVTTGPRDLKATPATPQERAKAKAEKLVKEILGTLAIQGKKPTRRLVNAVIKKAKRKEERAVRKDLLANAPRNVGTCHKCFAPFDTLEAKSKHRATCPRRLSYEPGRRS